MDDLNIICRFSAEWDLEFAVNELKAALLVSIYFYFGHLT